MNNYKEGEELLVYQGPLIYKAKCIAIRENGENAAGKEFLVHYAGWNKKWDEWVDDSRLLKLNDENLKLQTSLKTAHDNSKKKKKKAPEKRKSVATTKTAVTSTHENSPKTQASTSDAAAKKASSGNAPSSPSISTNDNETQKKQKGGTEDENENSPNIQIDIPDELKPTLVDDWDLINRQHKLPTTPAKITVATILEDYQKSKIRADTKPNKASSVEAVVSGLQDYFNVMLGTQLLYKFERPMYAELLTIHEGKDMIELYGFIHLVRLFIRLGQKLPYTQLDASALRLLKYHIQDFLKFLVKNISKYYSVSEYAVPPPEYHRKCHSMMAP